MYSTTSSLLGGGGPRNVNSAAQQASQVSTTTLLNAVHTIYTSGQSYKLDASTSLVVNTWLTATQADHEGRTGGTVDGALAARAWEHARRRAEDGCIVLGYGQAHCVLRDTRSDMLLALSTHLRLQYLLRSCRLCLCQYHNRFTLP